MKQIKVALKLFAILMILVGVIYPVAVTVLAQLFFPKEAGGSLLYDPGGNLTGSALIGQPFSYPNWQAHPPARPNGRFYFTQSGSGGCSSKSQQRRQSHLPDIEHPSECLK